MGAALFAFFVYIRFKQIEHYFRLFHQKSHHILNIIAVAFGLISALGMSIVGNFPELIQMYVHLFGAFLAFVGGSIYIVFQGYFTFKMLPHFSSKFTAYFRTFLGIFAMMMYFGAHTALIMAFEKTSDITRYEKKGMELLKWDPSDKGYSYRAASVIMEWFIVAMFNAFIVSFVSEFKKFSMEEPQCKFLAVEMDIEEDQKENEDHQGQGDTEGTIYTDDFTVDDDDADEETRATPVVYSEEVLNFKGVVVV
ncbi:DNA damage-regulated autophagy modulator protein 1 [Orchesella cincta]|uniref:DNA damage-regulated autophagy modulator protein 1 n=1 Tax=Orchesella cincta TaxID=48709 RepID=A0A1D2MH50_ORCCI|nr:DNA damage-regulated autophagy modulator protein 1 [Orchesella cincta]